MKQAGQRGQGDRPRPAERHEVVRRRRHHARSSACGACRTSATSPTTSPAKLITGEIKGTPGETFTVPDLNDGKPYTIGEKSVVILGPPFVFNKDNVNNFNF